MASATYYLTVGTSNVISASLPLILQSVAVDNPTDSYVHVIEADFYVPPHTSGWVIPVPFTTTVGTIRLEAPTGQTNVLTTGQVVTIIFRSDWSPFVSGTTNAVQAAQVSPTVVSAAPASRIRTLRGDVHTIPQNTTAPPQVFGAAFTDSKIWAITGNIAYFNCSVAANVIQILGAQTGLLLNVIFVVTPAATNLLWTSLVGTTWNTPLDLMQLLPNDTSYNMVVTTGPTTSTGDWALMLYASN